MSGPRGRTTKEETKREGGKIHAKYGNKEKARARKRGGGNVSGNKLTNRFPGLADSKLGKKEKNLYKY